MHEVRDKRKGKEKKGNKKRDVLPKQADSADRHALYQQAVQSPKNDVSFFIKAFHLYRNHKPLSLKEDFCGTALLCGEWVKSNFERTAIGVDIDKPTIDWGKQRNLVNLGPEADRITLICDDVRNVKSPKVDIVAALNYSFCVFKKRSLLVEYFKAVAQSLVKDGIFICDIFGGAEAVIPHVRSRDYGSFLYTWEQEWFNPLTHECRCHIGFTFPDKSSLRAFTYDWRWWSIPEIQECLEEAGFSSVKRWWKNEKRSKQNKQADKRKLPNFTGHSDDKDSVNIPESEETGDTDNDMEGSSEDDDDADPLSGEEMDEFIEVERVAQTKSWNAYVIGIL